MKLKTCSLDLYDLPDDNNSSNNNNKNKQQHKKQSVANLVIRGGMHSEVVR